MTVEHMEKETHVRTAEVEKIKAELASAVAVRDRGSAMHHAISKQLGDVQKAERDYLTAVSDLQNRRNIAIRNRDLCASGCASLRDRIKAIVPADYSSSIASAQAKIKELEKTAAAKEVALQNLKSEADAVQFWAEVGFQELRVKAVDALLVFLNARLAHYAQTIMGKDISVSLSHTDKGKIDLQVTSAGASYQSASGGEKDRIDVCIAFALLDLARQCTQWSSNILVLDEIATFVDASGVDRIMRAVTELMDQVESSFVISHNPVFEGYGDKVWTVIKEAGVSRLEQ